MYLSLKKLLSKYGTNFVLIFLYTVQSLKKVRVTIFAFILCRFSFVATEFLHSYFKQIWFDSCQIWFVPYMQTYLLNACKEENIFGFYVEQIASWFKILTNITSI